MVAAKNQVKTKPYMASDFGKCQSNANVVQKQRCFQKTGFPALFRAIRLVPYKGAVSFNTWRSGLTFKVAGV
jgi:hypothetical protein